MKQIGWTNKQGYLNRLSYSVGATTKGLVALAAGSTIAGNFTILGAASNVIIIQSSERKTGEILTFWEFIKIGILLTLMKTLVYWLFFLVF